MVSANSQVLGFKPIRYFYSYVVHTDKSRKQLLCGELILMLLSYFLMSALLKNLKKVHGLWLLICCFLVCRAAEQDQIVSYH